MGSRNRRRTNRHDTDRRLAATPVETPMGVIGFGGAQLPYSWRHDPLEFNPNLTGRAALDTWRKMLTTDAQIKGVSRIIDLPIRAAKWRIEAADDNTMDREVADFVEDNLFNSMEVTWDDALRQMLSAVMMGYSVHEKEFASVNGMVRLVSLWDRLQTTVERFVYAGDRTTGIMQSGTDYSGQYQQNKFIERERLLITTFEGVGGNAAGTPLCRTMYAPWFVKHPVLKLITIGLENSLVGTVWAKVPRSMARADRDNLRQAIEDLRVRDATGFVLDADVVLDILEGKRNPLDALPLIEYLDSQIAKVALAQMIQLGTTQSGSGSRAVSEDQSKMFLLSCNAIANMVEDNINRNLIPQLCRFNWPGLSAFPKIRHADVSRLLNLQNVGDALSKLCQGGLLHWTEDVENTVRDWYDFDPLPEDFQRPSPAAGGPDTLPAKANKPPVGGKAASATQATGPDDVSDDGTSGLTDRLCTCGGHNLTDTTRDRVSVIGDEFQTRAGVLLSGMISHLQARAQSLLSQLGKDGALEQARVYRALAAVDVPRRGELRLVVKGYFDALVEASRAAAAEVIGAEAPQISSALSTWIDAQADLLSQRLPDQVKSTYLQAVLSGITAEVDVAQLLSDAAQQSRDRANVDFRELLPEATETLGQHLTDELFAGSSD